MSSTIERPSQSDEAVLESVFVKANPTEAEVVAPGIKRQLLGFGNTIMGARVWFEKGAVGEAHAHVHAQMAYVESGVFEVTVDGRTEMLTAGDSFYARPHAMHGAVCHEAGVLIDVFSPWRQDFLASETSA